MGFYEQKIVPESAHNMLNEENGVKDILKSMTSFKECIHEKYLEGYNSGITVAISGIGNDGWVLFSSFHHLSF